MSFYRKKPVVIEARRVPIYNPLDEIQAYLQTSIDLADWCGGVGHLMNQEDEKPGPHIEIKTLEGTMLAEPGDWIIKGIKGEFYPCKHDIFEATYELVEKA